MAMEVIFSNFEKYIGTIFQNYIVPIIPFGAPLSPKSQLPADDLGKVPGWYKPDPRLWTGFPKWTDFPNYSTTTWVQRFQKWQEQYGYAVPIGFILGEILDAVDIDTNDLRRALWIRSLSEEIFGETPVVRRRDGNEARMVLLYRHKPNTQAIAPPIRYIGKDEAGERHLTEVLGRGRHVVIEGPHKSGMMQYWENGGLLDHAEEMPEITYDQVFAWKKELRGQGEMLHGLRTINPSSVRRASDRAATHRVDDLTSPYFEPNRDRLTEALQHINPDHEQIDYDVFINLLRAVSAAAAGDKVYLEEIVRPWACTQTIRKGNGPLTRDRDPAWLEGKWVSFTDSMLGPEYIYAWAARCGYDEAINEYKAEKAEGIFGPPPDDDDDAPTLGGGGSGGGAGGGGSGSTGPLPSISSHHAIVNDLAAQLQPTWRYNIDAKAWYHYETGLWARSEGLQELVEAHCAAVAAQVLATVNGPTGAQRAERLNSVNNWLSVIRGLAGRTDLHVTEAQFDANPHLLNTPDCVVDLRMRFKLPHDPSYLMRRMTKVSPNWEVLIKCSFAGEQWQDYMPMMWRGMTNTACEPGDPDASEPDPVRPGMIEAKGRWAGYSFSGWMHHQNLMFTHGAPGIGKSQLEEALYEISGTYGHIPTDNFLAKTDDGKRFDIMQLAGVRFAFQDETKQGQGWDETRASKVATSAKLSGEIKGGKVGVAFTNTAKLTIVGNHKPHFTSGETGGLTSRLLLFEAGGLNYRDRTDDRIDNMSRKIVEQEGSVVLAWVIEQARLDWEDMEKSGAEWAKLMAPLRAAAIKYTREDSILRRWIDERGMAEREDLDIDTSEALSMFQAFAKGQEDRSARGWKMSTFKQALKKACPSIQFDTRTKGRHPNRAYIIGFGLPTAFDVKERPNVVPFTPAHKS